MQFNSLNSQMKLSVFLFLLNFYTSVVLFFKSFGDGNISSVDALSQQANNIKSTVNLSSEERSYRHTYRLFASLDHIQI